MPPGQIDLDNYTLEALLNEHVEEYKERFQESIYERLDSVGIDKEMFSFDLNVHENDVVCTIALLSKPFSLVRHYGWLAMQDDELKDIIVPVLSKAESEFADEGIRFSGDLLCKYVIIDDDGKLIASASFTRDGRIGFEGEDTPLTLEDVWNDDLVEEAVNEYESAICTIPDDFEAIDPNVSSFLVAHDNELEVIIISDVIADSFDSSEMTELLHSETAVSEMRELASNLEDWLEESRIPTGEVAFRMTWKDTQDSTVVTCAYSSSGIIED